MSGPAYAQDDMQQGPTPAIARMPPVQPPKNDKAPELSAEERTRRQTTPSFEVSKEAWYDNGRAVFIAKCAGCHPAGTNQIKISKSLFWDDMERNGYGTDHRDISKIVEVTRYGKGKMPGFAADCADKSDYAQCGVIVALTEETLQDVEDFVVNRANAGWKGRG